MIISEGELNSLVVIYVLMLKDNFSYNSDISK